MRKNFTQENITRFPDKLTTNITQHPGGGNFLPSQHRVSHIFFHPHSAQSLNNFRSSFEKLNHLDFTCVISERFSKHSHPRITTIQSEIKMQMIISNFYDWISGNKIVCLLTKNRTLPFLHIHAGKIRSNNRLQATLAFQNFFCHFYKLVLIQLNPLSRYRSNVRISP